MAAALSLNGSILHKNPTMPPAAAISARHAPHRLGSRPRRWWWGPATALPLLRRPPTAPPPPAAGSRADDSSAPFEMSFESALKLLGVSESASFDDILRAKNAVLASCKDDQEAVAQVEAAYDMLLMQSLSQRRAGKVVNSSIRYADVKPVRSAGTRAMPKWLQKTVKNVSVSVESPSTGNFGVQAGVYGALMAFTFVSGTSTSSAGTYTGADVPGIILATSFGASLYFLSKKSISLGKATIITVGGLVVGAVVGSAVEKWLQVDIVPFFGIHSPAVIVSEFILFSQFLVSLCLR
ncbi:protein CHAPERONE-LIKE PROTEIN OF POR1, chloroplastic isoform X1 [Elaeis guineensis]|uniref:Protein CHAPERONE-LIKE PROTEIN OF POR1, chloroplastic n=1 Tax=Elaeis guineensis var. tenera TaxID=51953 RepID=A0A6I9QZT9_ELAGV|nr:protein CHAPERONE-LIKE PROTEIN OF POR1, chloroplastic [Elaeis guineensis]